MSEAREMPDPVFRLTVDGLAGPYLLEASWSLTETDASSWRQPITIAISAVGPLPPGEEAWETVFFLSREDTRLLRDYFDVLLRSPDLRQEDGEVWDNGRREQPA